MRLEHDEMYRRQDSIPSELIELARTNHYVNTSMNLYVRGDFDTLQSALVHLTVALARGLDAQTQRMIELVNMRPMPPIVLPKE